MKIISEQEMLDFGEQFAKDCPRVIELIGDVGTGKTTFIKWIQNEIDKNFLLLAPTGIAALNVGGQTMHSFFGFPLEVIGPRTYMEVSLEKRNILEKSNHLSGIKKMLKTSNASTSFFSNINYKYKEAAPMIPES